MNLRNEQTPPIRLSIQTQWDPSTLSALRGRDTSLLLRTTSRDTPRSTQEFKRATGSNASRLSTTSTEPGHKKSDRSSVYGQITGQSCRARRWRNDLQRRKSLSNPQNYTLKSKMGCQSEWKGQSWI